jgi:transcriptional regulator with XRE-family HTH domain
MGIIDNILMMATAKNLSDQDLCKVLNTHTSKIYDWKKGRAKPSAVDIKILADYFDVTTDFLLGNEKIAPFSLKEQGYISNEEREAVKNLTQEAFETRRVLFSKLDTTSVDDMKKVIAIIDMLKGTNNE